MIITREGLERNMTQVELKKKKKTMDPDKH